MLSTESGLESYAICQNYIHHYLSLNTENFIPGKPHPVLSTSSGSPREAARIPVKLRLLTGTYILQTTRAAFNQHKVNPTCLMCGTADETVNHFLLDCAALSNKRAPIIDDIMRCYNEICVKLGISKLQVGMEQLIVDSSVLLNMYPLLTNYDILDIHYHTVRLVYTLHCAR